MIVKDVNQISKLKKILIGVRFRILKYTQIEKRWIKSIPKRLKPSKAVIEKIIKRARKQRKKERDEFGF